MHSNNSEKRCGLWLRAFAALWGVLALVAVFSAGRAAAAPFAYVTNVVSFTEWTTFGGTIATTPVRRFD